jgi:hypothetical protein
MSASSTKSHNIDDEWAQFITSGENDSEDSDDDQCSDAYYAASNLNTSSSNDEFKLNKLNNTMSFSSMCTTSVKKDRIHAELFASDLTLGDAPLPSDLYISTKSKIEFLNVPIDIKQLFWNIKVMPYSTPATGVIKKQIKFNSLDLEELNLMQERLKKEDYYEQHIIKSINNPNGRIKFKDVRKLSVGIAKKDIMSYRSKKKSAFYNCFVMILRIKIADTYREFHVKIFNTGKIELPGMQTDGIHEIVMSTILDLIQPHISDQLSFQNCSSTILINSNFNCGFYINREALYFILKNKYNIDAIYDPCSYPGIQCKFYYDVNLGVNLNEQKIVNSLVEKKKLIKVSFMIFRTGSVLIVGRCNEEILKEIYHYIKLLLQKEYAQIGHVIPEEDVISNALEKNKKIRKKLISVHSNEDLVTSNNCNVAEEQAIISKSVKRVVKLVIEEDEPARI